MAAPAAFDRQHNALQIIFSFFLGLMVLAFIGVGVNTFLQSPAERVQPEMDEIQRQMDAVNLKSKGRDLDVTQQAEMDRLSEKQNALQRGIQEEMKLWARNTSIVLVLFATLVMAVSLVRSEQLRALSNGLLLGGLFTMLYGTGWVIFSGNSTARFVVIAFALLVAIALGYLKFVRERLVKGEAAAGSADIAAHEAIDFGELAARVAALEQRASAAAAALGGQARGE
jgi:hypothetical protein